jgi:hypothetical protein
MSNSPLLKFSTIIKVIHLFKNGVYKTAEKVKRIKKGLNEESSECFGGFNFVVPLGFEPRAAGLENLCSIQLSYGTR